jgi:hypothetical protein
VYRQSLRIANSREVMQIGRELNGFGIRIQSRSQPEAEVGDYLQVLREE